MRRRIAIVTPWYGPEATGGAESLARELAARLARTDDVTVLTTTSRAFLSSWGESFFETGDSHEHGYRVKRFAVNRRDKEMFDGLNAELLGISPDRWHELEYRVEATDAFITESINSDQLERHLGEDARRLYDAVLFLPYLYGVVVKGIEAYPGPSFLIPCLHDEAYARIPRIRRAMYRAAGLLYNSEGERELARRLLGPGVIHKGTLIGSGVEVDSAAQGASPVSGEFVLYLGRRDSTKNVDTLIEAFRAYAASRNGAPHASKLQLVLAGPGNQSFDDLDAGIIDLGFVDDATKAALLASARALVQPSTNESYSRVIMEAWLRGIPVVVHGDCLATATAVSSAGGGMLARSPDQWAQVFAHLEAAPAEELQQLAARGREYAAEASGWPRVVENVRRAIGLSESVESKGARIDQVVQTLEFGDAISEYTMYIRDHLRSMGYESSIYAEGIGPKVIEEATTFQSDLIRHTDALIYHHSIRCAATAEVASAKMRKGLVYHNITPSRFFRPYGDWYADLVEEGRRQTGEVIEHFDVLIADSKFNADELVEMGAVHTPIVVPPVVDFSRFDVLADPEILKRPHKGSRWLYVGRVAPNKGLVQLIEAFEVFRTLDLGATLSIVGRYDPTDQYYLRLERMVRDRSLGGAVTFTGMVSDDELHAYYRFADVFVTLSEHEGFCVPLVEAMMFDLPIVAVASTAIPETLGEGGLMVQDTRDPYLVACLAYEVLADGHLRATVLEAQRARRNQYMPEAQRNRITELVELLLS